MKEVTEGEMFDIMGLECYAPVPPPLEQIQGFGLPPEEQKWRRTELPQIPVSEIEIFSGEDYESHEVLDWEAARREEYIGQYGADPWKLDRTGSPKVVPDVVADPTFFFPMMEEFRHQEFKRCHPLTGGHWVMIKGHPYWLTPFHYFYCNWWRLNTGYPEWRWIDALRFYHWQYVFVDENCYGEAEASKRGDGKTYRVTAKSYLVSIYKKNAHSPIQSKTDDDAKKVFLDKMLEPYKDLPDFFIPINSHGTNPQSGFDFFAPSKGGKNAAAQRILQKMALRTRVDYGNAKENTYDGANANGVFIRDEEGKTEVANVWLRHNITKDCVYRDGWMQGKIASTTTVEKWEKGGKNFKKLWDNSDPLKRDKETGETLSGLYKLWFPAYLTEYQDEWGFPDEELAKRKQGAKRRQLRNDADAYQKYTLQYPWTEIEMFQTSGLTCQYNLSLLRELEAMVNDPDFNAVRVGNFVPTDGIGSPIKWEDDEINGRWEVTKLLSPEEANKFKTVTKNGKISHIPLNEGAFSAGFDPTKTRNNAKKSRSAAAAAFMEKEDFWNPEATPNFVADYVWQPDDPELAYLDVLYGAMYYGCPFLPESNLGIANTLRDIGCEAFLMARPEVTYANPDKADEDEIGLPATEMSNDILLKKKKSWMAKHAWKLKQPRIIRDSIGFDPERRTEFDLEVGSQLAITAAEKIEKQQPQIVQMENLFPSFDNSSSQGRRN
jgi:hypothetical protein